MTAEPLDDSCNIQFDYAQLQLINNSINSAKSHLRITRNNCPGDINNAQSTKNNHTHTRTHTHKRHFATQLEWIILRRVLVGKKLV